MKLLRLLAHLLLIWTVMPLAMATSYPPPSDQVIKSPNGKFELRINAKSGIHSIHQGKKRLWKFKRDVWHDTYFLSEDGQRVLWLSWPYVKTDQRDDPALIVYGEKGPLRKASFSEVSKPRKYRKGEIGPIGEFWRIWREDAEQKGDLVTVPAGGGRILKIDFATLKISP